MGVGGCCLAPGFGERGKGPGRERGGVLAEGFGHRERLGVVVSKQLGLVVAFPGQPFDPRGGRHMLFGTICPADL